MIHQQIWAMLEWSAFKRAWIILDAAGQAVTIAGADRAAAIALAKRMIRDGSMPDPATAHAELEQQIQREHQHSLGEPMQILEDEREIVPIHRNGDDR
jgi:hypothetical protein